MWPEVEKVKIENRYEIILSGKKISDRIEQHGMDFSIFELSGLNYLNISETSLSEIPDQIKNLSNLQTLVLHTNRLQKVNAGISELSKLKVLDLSRNSIENIPETFTSLIQLVTVNLNGNNLKTFPSFEKSIKLAVVDLSNNNLKSFPDICFEELINLSELKVAGNEIDQIPGSISKLPALKVFDISANKLKSIPGELADCLKLKEINLKSNPISDKRLLKLIEQCRTKQVLDYVKHHCPKLSTNTDSSNKKGKIRKKNQSDEISDEDNASYKYSINIKYADDNFKVVVMKTVKNIREHIIGCIVDDISFTEESFKKCIQLQNKLHDTICGKRNNATIATHDFNKLPPGDLVYTTALPNELIIKPLNRSNLMTGVDLFNKLQTEANNLRKEKKRNTYSGIHKYLYLIEGKAQYPCLLNDKKEVISFPPITNSDLTKIERSTTRLFIEVTSSLTEFTCKTVLDTLLKDLVLLLETDLNIRQVRMTNLDGELKTVYPSKVDLNFDKTVPIKVNRL